MGTTIRRIEARDEARWRRLWTAYCAFYEWAPADAMIDHTWNRIMDEASPVFACVAVNEENKVVGIANYLLHESTTAFTPVCYLQDLFVDPTQRASGIGEQILDWLVDQMHTQKWTRLYWNTRENNYRARGLYDRYTNHSGFLRYALTNAEQDRARLAEPDID
jgi:GNAT superfamily N-acetyltransferase